MEDATEEQSEGTGTRRDTAEDEQSEREGEEEGEKRKGGTKAREKKRAEHQRSHGKEGHTEKDRQQRRSASALHLSHVEAASLSISVGLGFFWGFFFKLLLQDLVLLCKMTRAA